MERQAVFENQARVFVLASGNLSGTAMAIAFLKSLGAMSRFIDEHPAPFMAKVYKSGEVRSWKF